MKIKLTSADGGQWLAQAGTFDFVVKTIEEGVAVSSGNPMFTVILSESTGKGDTTLYLPTTESALWKLKQFVKYCLGMDIADGEEIDFDTDDIQKCIGCSIGGVMEESQYTKPDAIGNPEVKISYKLTKLINLN